MICCRNFVISLALSLLLLACASQPKIDPVDNAALLNQAEAYLAEGNYSQAARLLDQQTFDLLNQEQQQRHLIAQAQAGIGLRSSSRILDALSSDKAQVLEPLELDAQIEFSLWRAQALEWQGHWSAAIGERLFVAPLMEPEQAQRNNDQIWFLIQRLPRSELNHLLAENLAYDWLAWLRLAEARMNNPDDSLFASQLMLWQAQFANSTAANPLANELQAYALLLPQELSIIALLLPLSGPLESAGQAILSGFMASYYNQEDNTFRVLVKDTYQQDIHNLAREAINEGAQFLVGPLERNQVEELLNSSINVPVLALNHASGTRANLFQFALAPEQEVGILVRHQQQMGYSTGATLLEGAELSRRQHHASLRLSQEAELELIDIQELGSNRDTWLAEVRQFLRFDPRARDRARITRQAADSSSSVNRSLENSPIRDDIEYMNLFATAEGSSLIRPLLNLNFAERLPSYGTSQLLLGNQLRDLDQMFISVLPWQVSPSELRLSLEDRHGNLGRLEPFFAMGIDAQDLLAPLHSMRQPSELSIQGQTGRLTLSPKGLIQRELLLVQVQSGQLKLVDWPD